MANQPLIIASVTVTARDINNNNVAKTFTEVSALHFDYAKGMVNIVCAAGSFFFALGSPMTTITYTIVAGALGNHSVVMS